MTFEKPIEKTSYQTEPAVVHDATKFSGRLRIAADEVLKNCGSLNMNSWSSIREVPSGRCGTTYCAAGFAALNPAIKAQGFTLAKVGVGMSNQTRNPSLIVMFKRALGFDACKNFFGTNFPFQPGSYPSVYGRVLATDVVHKLRAYADFFENQGA